MYPLMILTGWILGVLVRLGSAQLKILSPAPLASDLTAVSHKQTGDKSVKDQSNGFILGATATFGTPHYGDSLVGRIYYVPSSDNYCTDSYAANLKSMLNLDVGDNDKFLGASTVASSAAASGKSVTVEGQKVSDELKKFFLVTRGSCTFVRKAWVAQMLGADAVIIVDSPDSLWQSSEMLSVILADDGTGSRVRIPSLMIGRQEGKLLLDTFAKEPTLDVVALLQWSLPQRSVVAVDFWTESGNTAGQRFLESYAYHANLLNGRLRFQPHYYVWGLVPLGSNKLPPSNATADEKVTGSDPTASDKLNIDIPLCLPNDASICSNPGDLFGSAISGRDVLWEDARQLCLWELTAKPVEGIEDSRYSQAWWEYVRQFNRKCVASATPKDRTLSLFNIWGEASGDSPAFAHSPLFDAQVGAEASGFTEACSVALMKTIPGVDADEVIKCVRERGRELLSAEKRNRAWNNLALRINGAKFSGALDPVQVSRAVCTAFEKPPAVCKDVMALDGHGNKNGAALSETNSMATARTHTAVAVLLVLVIGSISGFMVHQYFVRKMLRSSLRHEVMLEVRSQLQDYQPLDDERLGFFGENVGKSTLSEMRNYFAGAKPPRKSSPGNSAMQPIIEGDRETSSPSTRSTAQSFNY